MTKTDYYSIGVYLLVGLAILLTYCFNLLTQSKINYALLGFGLVGSLILYSYYSNRLRSINIIIIWSIIALFQILLYQSTKSNIDFKNAIGGSYLKSLLYLPLFLIVFLSLRLTYKLIYNRELIINMKRYYVGENVENRKITWADNLFTGLGIMIIIFGLDLINL